MCMCVCANPLHFTTQTLIMEAKSRLHVKTCLHLLQKPTKYPVTLSSNTIPVVCCATKSRAECLRSYSATGRPKPMHCMELNKTDNTMKSNPIQIWNDWRSKCKEELCDTNKFTKSITLINLFTLINWTKTKIFLEKISVNTRWPNFLVWWVLI